MSNVVAMDVERVLARDPNGATVGIPARVAVVNSSGQVLYDTFVQPRYPVINFLPEHNGGITKEDLDNGVSFRQAQQQVINLINGRILVGHDLQHNDLGVFDLTHNNTRDTATYPPFMQRYGGGNKPSLRQLAKEILNYNMTGNHDPVEDARVTMKIYMKNPW